jgi:hypothetical protein
MSTNDDSATVSKWLEAIHQAIKDHAESVAKYQQSEQSDRQQQAQTGINTVVRLPIEVSEYYRAEQGERPVKNRRERIRITLEIVGVIAAVGLAFITFITLLVFNKQLSEMKTQTKTLSAQAVQSAKDAQQQLVITQQQANAAQNQAKAAQENLDVLRQQFQQDQRPMIAITNVVFIDMMTGKDIPAPLIGKPIGITIYFKNIGKSQALKVVTHRHLLFGDKVSDIRPEPPDKNSYGGVLESGSQEYMTAVSVRDTYSVESVNVNPAEVVNWDGSEPIIIFGRITYRDSSGNLYCRPYVEHRLPSGDWLIVESIRGKNISVLCPTGKP